MKTNYIWIDDTHENLQPPGGYTVEAFVSVVEDKNGELIITYYFSNAKQIITYYLSNAKDVTIVKD